MEKIIDKYYNELKPIIEKIRGYKCQNCGGNFINSNCAFCDSLDNALKIELEKIRLLLDNFSKEIISLNHNIKINKLFNLLYTLNDSQDIINNFLDKYNYKQLFNEFSKETIKKLDNPNTPFTDLELNTIETIIYQKNNQYNLKYIYQYFINRCINKKQNVSLECFQEITKQIAEETLKPFYSNTICILKEYKPIEENGNHFIKSGENKAQKIFLNIDEINNLYHNQDPTILITLFHESIHGAQYKNIFHGKQDIDPLVILEIKDYILSKHIPTYYKENYENISFEIEADYLGNFLACQYINKNRINHKIESKYENILNTTRTLNKKINNIDTIFNDFIINHPELLKKHYQLQYLYKIHNNKVIPLNEEELYNQYQLLISNNNISNEQKKKYKLLFSQYINIKVQKNG